MTARELGEEETALAYEAMAELRPHLGSAADFVARVDGQQRPEGYRLVASFADGPWAAVAAMGFRTGHSLAWGRFLYIDDLVTLPTARGQGHASSLLAWAVEEAGSLGCDQIHLDSGHARHDAHRLYLQRGFRITGHHFSQPIGTDAG